MSLLEKGPSKTLWNKVTLSIDKHIPKDEIYCLLTSCFLFKVIL